VLPDASLFFVTARLPRAGAAAELSSRIFYPSLKLVSTIMQLGFHNFSGSNQKGKLLAGFV
jgi:hypothetical protein